MPRYLIEAAAGVYTGSVYNDKSILRAGHHGEARSYRDGSTLLQKTHHRALTVDRYKVRDGDNIIMYMKILWQDYDLGWRRRHVSQFGGRGVLVVRNPYKAILSYWNFKVRLSTRA